MNTLTGNINAPWIYEVDEFDRPAFGNGATVLPVGFNPSTNTFTLYDAPAPNNIHNPANTASILVEDDGDIVYTAAPARTHTFTGKAVFRGTYSTTHAARGALDADALYLGIPDVFQGQIRSYNGIYLFTGETGASAGNRPFGIFIGDTERFSLDNNGQVGVNKSTSLGAQLHVSIASPARVGHRIDLATTHTENALEVRASATDGGAIRASISAAGKGFLTGLDISNSASAEGKATSTSANSDAAWRVVNNAGVIGFFTIYGSAFGFGLANKTAFGGTGDVVIQASGGVHDGGSSRILFQPSGYNTSNTVAYFDYTGLTLASGKVLTTPFLSVGAGVPDANYLLDVRSDQNTQTRMRVSNQSAGLLASAQVVAASTAGFASFFINGAASGGAAGLDTSASQLNFYTGSSNLRASISGTAFTLANGIALSVTGTTTLTANAATTIPLRINLTTSQTANAVSVYASDGTTVLAGIGSAGAFNFNYNTWHKSLGDNADRFYFGINAQTIFKSPVSGGSAAFQFQTASGIMGTVYGNGVAETTGNIIINNYTALAANTVLNVRGANGQTGELQRWQSWNGVTATTVAKVNNVGSANFGSSFVGSLPTADFYALFAHKDRMGTGQHTILVHPDGSTYINGVVTRFDVNGADILTINSVGASLSLGKDFEIMDKNKGLILTDRTLNSRHRLLLNTGVISIEAA